MLHAARKHASHLLVPEANRRTKYDCWDWRVQERHVESLRLPKSEPQPKLRRPKHRCAHPAHWKYMMGSQTKYAWYRNIRRSLRKLSKKMVVAPALWRRSIWIHCQAYRRLVWSTQTHINCSLYHCMHCSWSDRHFMEERNKIHSFIAWDWIWRRKSRGKNAERHDRGKQ